MSGECGQYHAVVDTEYDSQLPTLRGTLLVAAPERTVAAALAEPWLFRQCVEPFGVRVLACDTDQLGAGDELVVALPVPRLPLTLRVVRADEHGLLMVGGGGLLRRLQVHATVAATGAGTLLTYGIGWVSPGAVVGRLADVVFGRRLVLRLLSALLAGVRTRAEQLATAPVVVGAAILGDGTVLAAQRDRPPVAAGRWEFPGGRVEVGEDERAALIRECHEELAADVVVTDRLGPDLVLANGWVLRIYLARLAPGAEPVATEHRAMRWVSADQLAGLDWLDADRIVLPGLRPRLTPCSSATSGSATSGWWSQDRAPSPGR
jgi:8-oxo-dGTP diphosphatase